MEDTMTLNSQQKQVFPSVKSFGVDEEPSKEGDKSVTWYNFNQITTPDSSHTAEHDKDFWSLVEDEQVELFTPKEKPSLPAKSKTVVPYSTVYTPPSDHIFDLKEPTKMTVRPEVHKQQRDRKSAYVCKGTGESTASFLARKKAKKLARK
jgi:hypothetical protein